MEQGLFDDFGILYPGGVEKTVKIAANGEQFCVAIEQAE